MKKLSCLLLPFLFISLAPKKYFDFPVKYPSVFVFKFSPYQTQFILNSLPSSTSPSNEIQTILSEMDKQIKAQIINDSVPAKK